MKKRINALFVLFLLTFFAVFMLSACSKNWITGEIAIKYLTEEDYLSGDTDGKLKESIELALGQKAYAVIDVRLSDLKNVDESVKGQLYVDFSSFDFNIEELPTADYLLFGNEIQASFKLHDGKKTENNFRFIFSIIGQAAREDNIYVHVSTDTNIPVRNGYFAYGYITVTEEAEIQSKLDFTLSADGTYYTVTGLGGENGDKITVPNSYNGITVKEIADNVFSNVGYLKEVTLPSGLTKIGANAFKNCVSLTGINIPSGVTEIGSEAFKGCASLEEIKIPLSTAVMGDKAFGGCPDMHLCCETEKKPDGWSESSISDILLITWSCNKSYIFDLNDDGRSYYLKSATGVSGNTVVPGVYKGLPVTQIGESAFNSCGALTGIAITDGITEIGKNAFFNCVALTSITMTDSVTVIGEKAFSGCAALKSVTVSNKVTVIEPYTFENCRELTALTIPEGVTQIGEGAFYSCQSLTSAEIPKGVKKIEDYAFYACTGLTSVLIPEGITKINKAVFYECESLASVDIPSSVTAVGESAFEGCSKLSSITVPGTVSSIEKNAFASCSGATSITLENGIKTIGQNAFIECTAITEITVPNSVTDLGDGAFGGCTRLESAVIGNGVTIIKAVFNKCEKLNRVSLGSGVTKIEARAFSGCMGLTHVTLIGKTWYRTEKSSYYGGYEVKYTYDSLRTAELLRSTYVNYYWYKK